MHPSVRRRVLSVSAAAALATALAGGGAAGDPDAAAGDWTAFGGGPSHRFWNPHETTITSETVGSLAPAYRVTTPRPPVDDPIVARGKVFQAHRGGVAAYAAKGGRLLWNHTIKPGPTDIAWSGGGCTQPVAGSETRPRCTRSAPTAIGCGHTGSATS